MAAPSDAASPDPCVKVRKCANTLRRQSRPDFVAFPEMKWEPLDTEPSALLANQVEGTLLPELDRYELVLVSARDGMALSQRDDFASNWFIMVLRRLDRLSALCDDGHATRRAGLVHRPGPHQTGASAGGRGLIREDGLHNASAARRRELWSLRPR